MTNLTDAPLQGVTVQEVLPGNFRIATSDGATFSNPNEKEADRHIPHQYALGELRARMPDGHDQSHRGRPGAGQQLRFGDV